MPEQRKIVTAEPENSETPLETLRSWGTPTRLFFVRNHFHTPALDLREWHLYVEGCVAKPATWSFDDLAKLPERTVLATVECAGNGRSFLTPHVHGVQWGAGAVGHAEWTGVPLRLVLERAGVRPEATEVLFEGHDRGSEADHPETMHFARSLPLAKAMHPDTLLATRMNGEPLEPIHGFPLRLFVPGWYGVASVKWLKRIAVIDHHFDGYYQSTKYTYQQRSPNGEVVREIVGPMIVKAEIIRPTAQDALGLGSNRVFGVAWAGEEAVAAVEVSTDAGRTWTRADLIGPRAEYSWTLWEYPWEVARPGAYTLLARAVSAGGQKQPMEHDPLRGGYLIHFCRPVTVRVEAAGAVAVGHADYETILYDMNAFAEANSRRPLDVDLEFMAGDGI
jgi:DMSO/TMAO reductase YedYZ molybdopterin-dependent catalytic subunit